MRPRVDWPGPPAQTPRQRARARRQTPDARPAVKALATAYAWQLDDGYVAGALRWADVRAALDAPA